MCLRVCVCVAMQSVQALCFRLGLNCYIETHMNMVSADTVAFCRIFDACPVPFEVSVSVRPLIAHHAATCAAIAHPPRPTSLPHILPSVSLRPQVNADISHYSFRGIRRGDSLARILARVGPCARAPAALLSNGHFLLLSMLACMLSMAECVCICRLV